jgi:Domain of unknown function (DUF4190)
MKTCPACKQSYTDNDLNFCLNDGVMLVASNTEPPPTIFMDAPRSTNQNWQGTQQNTNFQNQQISPNQQFSQPMYMAGQNQTLPIVSLVLGILSLLLICCWGGIPFGIASIVTGYLGMRSIKSNPQLYSGNGLAIGGIVCGILSFLITFGMIILVIITPTK